MKENKKNKGLVNTLEEVNVAVLEEMFSNVPDNEKEAIGAFLRYGGKRIQIDDVNIETTETKDGDKWKELIFIVNESNSKDGVFKYP